jgi:hypothetical protein
MPVLAATATGKIVEGIVPPIKVGLLVQHLVAEPYIVGCLVIRLWMRANLRFRSFMGWPCIHSVLSASIGSVFPARIAGLRVATSRGASRTSRDAR